MAKQGQILVRSSGTAGGWSNPSTTSYSNEAHLQSILVADPGQIPGVSDDSRSVAELWTSAGPADVCVVDSDGSLTVVECKLASNQEQRRMVIGQVLDYASALYSDGPEAFLASWREGVGEDPDDYLSTEALISLRDNIENARINLCLAVDAIDDDIRRLVEYLNRATAAEVRVVALQLEYASHDGVEILIPTTFGDELADAIQSSSSAFIPWTWEGFLDAIHSDGDRQIAEELYRLLHSADEPRGDHALLWFGAQPGGGIYMHPYGVRFSPLQLWVNAAGGLLLYGNWNNVYPATSAHPAYERLAQLLGRDHTKGCKGVPAGSVDLDAVWNEVLRVALATNGFAEDL